jgi:Predicted membrane protein (DUF2306)
MGEAAGIVGGSTTIRPGPRVIALLGIATLVSLIFIAVAALPYFSLNEAQFRTYWPRRGWLLLHITTGIVAILTGPVQLWLGLSDRYPAIHRRLGLVYLGSITVSSVAAYYLALHTDGGWVFGSGLAGLATAWLVTSSLAFLAIKRHLYEQHKEWMVRSYVVTLGFVTFRILFSALEASGVGTLPEQLGVAAWFCWSVPLLVTEAVLQGRRILAVRAD